VAFCSAIPTIPVSAGVPRVIHGTAVPYLFGDPSLPADREYALRERLTERALETLGMELATPTVFSVS
jgi:hypothetical protein